MPHTNEEEMTRFRENASEILHELRFGVHRLGYQQLLVLIPRYVQDSRQSLSKELYPYAAEYFGYTSWKPVEHAVRLSIRDAWERRIPGAWEEYFPGVQKVPSNKQFIAVLAEVAKNAPPG